MKANRPERPATYADLETLPEHVVGEIVSGTLHVNPRPAAPHARASSRLGTQLGGPFDMGTGGPGGWILLDEPELHLIEDVVIPDLAGWRRERMPELPDVKWFELAPDWVCEIASPSTEQFDRAEKLPVYARAAVKHVWIVNPLEKFLEVLRLENGAWVIVGTFAAPSVRAEPFEAIALDLAALWAR